MGTPKNCRVAKQSTSEYTDAETIDLYTIPIPGQGKDIDENSFVRLSRQLFF